MPCFKYILFDLDGTITDPGFGITNSVMYALNKMGIKVSDRRELYRFIGPPLWESFESFYGLSHDEADKAVDFYREYYLEKGIYECLINDGLNPLLSALKESSRHLYIATSKPEPTAIQVLSYFKLDRYFDYIAGSSMDRSRAEKDKVISYALEVCNIVDLKSTVMIGDREHDILGAKKNGLASIGVLFGYGSCEELEKAGADYIASSADDISKIILGR